MLLQASQFNKVTPSPPIPISFHTHVSPFQARKGWLLLGLVVGLIPLNLQEKNFQFETSSIILKFTKRPQFFYRGIKIGCTFRLEPENIVDYNEWNEKEWNPNDFNKNIPEKDVKKRKVSKRTLSLDDEVSFKGQMFKNLTTAL